MKASRTPNYEKTLEQSQTESCYEFSWTISGFARANRLLKGKKKNGRYFAASEESKLSQGRQPSELTETKRTPQIPWRHLQTMTFTKPWESWNSNTVMYGCDQQICPGTFPPSWLEPSFENRRKVEGQGERSRRVQEAEDAEKRWVDRVMPSGRHHLGHGTNQRPGHPLLEDNGIRMKRVSVPNGDHRSEEWAPHLQGHLQGHPWRRK